MDFLKKADQEIGKDNNEGLKVELAKSDSGVLSKPKVNMSQDELDTEPEGTLTIDVYQTPTEIIVESAVAGVDPEKDLDINVTNDSITIKGQRRREHHVKDEDYFYQECYWGRFARSVILPQEVDAENSFAAFKNGVLMVHLPKLVRQKAKKVKVKIE